MNLKLNSTVNTLICRFSHATGTGGLGGSIFGTLRRVRTSTRTTVRSTGMGTIGANTGITNGMTSGTGRMGRGLDRMNRWACLFVCVLSPSAILFKSFLCVGGGVLAGSLQRSAISFCLGITAWWGCSWLVGF